MDILKTASLQKKDGSSVSVDDAFKDKKVVALYFSAHWCPPCKAFTPKLRMAYEDMMEDEDPIEVVFVSSDRDPDSQFSYMKEMHGDWLTIKHGDEAISKLKTRYEVMGIPALIVIKNDADSTLITGNGRGDIEKKGPGAFEVWNR